MKILIAPVIAFTISCIILTISIVLKVNTEVNYRNHKTVTVYHTNVVTNTVSDLDLLNSRLNQEIHKEIELAFKQLIDEEEIKHLNSKKTDSFVPITNGTVLFSKIYNKSFKVEEEDWVMKVYALGSNQIRAEIIATRNQLWNREHIEELKEKSK